MKKLKIKDLHHGRILYVVMDQSTLSEVTILGKPQFDGKYWTVRTEETTIIDEIRWWGKHWFKEETYLIDLGIRKDFDENEIALPPYKAFKKLKQAKAYMEWLKKDPESIKYYAEFLYNINSRSDFGHADNNSGMEGINFPDGKVYDVIGYDLASKEDYTAFSQPKYINGKGGNEQ